MTSTHRAKRHGTKRASWEAVALLLSRIVSRSFLAVLLLAIGLPASKVICVGPMGHEAVEDWVAQCCASGLTESGSEFRDASACHGCTDYMFTAVAEFQAKHVSSSPHVVLQSYVGPAVVPAQTTPFMPMDSLMGSESLIRPSATAPVSISLRC